MIIHVKLSGSAFMVQCSINAVLMQQCCCLGCSLSPWGQGAHTGCDINAVLKPPVLALVLCCALQTHLVLCASSLVPFCVNAQDGACYNGPETSVWPRQASVLDLVEDKQVVPHHMLASLMAAAWNIVLYHWGKSLARSVLDFRSRCGFVWRDTSDWVG